AWPTGHRRRPRNSKTTRSRLPSHVAPGPPGLRGEPTEEASARMRRPEDIRGSGRAVPAAPAASTTPRAPRPVDTLHLSGASDLASDTATWCRSPPDHLRRRKAWSGLRSHLAPGPPGLRSELEEEASVRRRRPEDIRGAGQADPAAPAASTTPRAPRPVGTLHLSGASDLASDAA